MARTTTDAQRKMADAAEFELNGYGAPEGTPMIYTLIGRAMGEIQAIGKDSEATNFNGKKMYNFRGIDAVYNAMNPVMAKYGLFITPEILEQTREERKSSNGNALIYSILKIRFTMYAPDGSFIQSTLIGEGMDSGDKATNKAMSIAMKYFCFQVFMIPTEEMKETDPDRQVYEVARKQEQQVKLETPKIGTLPAKPAAAETKKPQSKPANVTTAPRIPEAAPNTTTVKGYLQNEIAFMAGLFGITEKREMGAKFESMRKALIASGTIPDINSADLTMDQAKQLIEAVYENFLSDKRNPA